MIDETMKEWMMICIIAAGALCLLFGMFSCMSSDVKKRNQWIKENPTEAAQGRCYSKVSGSRPACWSEGDWKVFCERVQCKQ
jgi:hypothetical protein